MIIKLKLRFMVYNKYESLKKNFNEACHKKKTYYQFFYISQYTITHSEIFDYNNP